MFYYFLAYKKIKNKKEILFSVPSGNFGNICAGILSKSMGLPIDHFIASTNINDTIPRYIKDGVFEPHLTKRTISNAMDVSEPSNFIRIQKIFNNWMIHFLLYIYCKKWNKIGINNRRWRKIEL